MKIDTEKVDRLAKEIRDHISQHLLRNSMTGAEIALALNKVTYLIVHIQAEEKRPKALR